MGLFRQDARFCEPEPLFLFGQVYLTGSVCSLSGASNFRMGGPSSIQRNGTGSYSIILASNYPVIYSSFSYERSGTSGDTVGNFRMAQGIGTGLTGTSPNYSGAIVPVTTASFEVVDLTGSLADPAGTTVGAFVNVLLVCNTGGPRYPY